MSNKTCGECKHFYDYENRRSPCCWSKPTDNACLEFDPKVITNGDKLAGDRNCMAAVIIAANGKICHFCSYYVNKKCTAPEGKNCFHGVVDWLNAPAKSEVEE